MSERANFQPKEVHLGQNRVSYAMTAYFTLTACIEQINGNSAKNETMYFSLVRSPSIHVPMSRVILLSPQSASGNNQRAP